MWLVNIVHSAWKSGLGTAKRPRLNRTKTDQDRKFPGPIKTVTAVWSSVYHHSENLKTDQRPVSTSWNRSLQPSLRYNFYPSTWFKQIIIVISTSISWCLTVRALGTCWMTHQWWWSRLIIIFHHQSFIAPPLRFLSANLKWLKHCS